MKIDLEELSEKELIELKRRIVERLKFLESIPNDNKVMDFDVGEKVAFKAPGLDKQTGVLVEYNPKTATIVTELGERWNVSPYLLLKTSDAGAVSKNESKVVNTQEQK
jgi:uncharacterized protein involved in tellurium resistance